MSVKIEYLKDFDKYDIQITWDDDDFTSILFNRSEMKELSSELRREGF